MLSQLLKSMQDRSTSLRIILVGRNHGSNETPLTCPMFTIEPRCSDSVQKAELYKAIPSSFLSLYLNTKLGDY